MSPAHLSRENLKKNIKHAFKQKNTMFSRLNSSVTNIHIPDNEMNEILNGLNYPQK